MKQVFYFLVFLAVIVIACEEIDDPAAEARNPVVEVDFVPARTKSLVDSLLAGSNDSIKQWQDSIQHGGDSIYLTSLIVDEEIIRDSLNEISTLLKANRVHLDSVYAIGGLILEEYQDTTNTIFGLPLNLQSDSTTYIFKYLNLADTLTFKYQTRVISGLDKINVAAYNLSITKSTFDSLSRHFCLKESCTSGEILYKVYF